MAVKHGQLRKKTLVDSNRQKCRWLAGCVTSICQSEDPLLKVRDKKHFCGHAANASQVTWPHKKDGYRQLG